jgi:thiamine pyrophosphate-dependent acetolactate synthase large subunit-like protein
MARLVPATPDRLPGGACRSNASSTAGSIPTTSSRRFSTGSTADDIVACGNATATIVPFQAGAIKRGMRMFSNSGSASMGYDLPAAIGAYFGAVATRGTQRRVICLAGDGSIMMNLQELQTIAQHGLPIKIFVLDNRGYLSIRTSQTNFFGRLAGADPDSGVSLPDFVAVATAFGIPARRLDSAPTFRNCSMASWTSRGPACARSCSTRRRVRTAHEFAQTRRWQHRLAAAGGHVSLPRPG